MKLSQLNIKKINLKEVDQDYIAQDILTKLGELYQYESGIYGYGNIWTKMERLIENIIIEELDKVGCIQVEFPKLQPKKIWDQSSRWNTYTEENDIMFTLDNNLGTYGLAPTAEECATIFGANRLRSYKNLPAIYYQIGEKFRKEIRARGYLFRPRTFVMMDAYSFDKNDESMQRTYQLMHHAYLNIFARLGIPIIPTVSDNGTMGGNVSEEFQAITKLGEDIILYDEDQNIGMNKEVLSFSNKTEYLKQLGIETVEGMKEYHATELGNNFQLGTKYSESMKLFYMDENDNPQPYYMGCYGIGVGRIIATILENNIVEREGKVLGFSIPFSVAPYKLQIIYKESRKKEAEQLYQLCNESNLPVIFDDRENFSLGNKIKDGYVLGTPYLAILGEKTLDDKIEIEETKTGNKYMFSSAEIIELLSKGGRNKVL